MNARFGAVERSIHAGMNAMGEAGDMGAFADSLGEAALYGMGDVLQVASNGNTNSGDIGNERPKSQPKSEPSATPPREAARQALQQSIERRW